LNSHNQILSNNFNGDAICSFIDTDKKRGYYLFKDLLNGAATQLAHEYNTVEKKLDLDTVNYGYIAISASRAIYHNFYFKRDNKITAQKVIKVNMDPQKEPNFPKVGLTDIHGQFFELPLISQVLYHLVYVAIATRTNADQEYL
jgi:hypothetical protein